MSAPARPPARARSPRVAHPPGHARDVAAVAVDRDDLLDVWRRRQPEGQGAPDPVSRSGYCHDRHRLIPCAVGLCLTALLVAALVANRPPAVLHRVLPP